MEETRIYVYRMPAVRVEHTKAVKWLHISFEVWWNPIPKNLISKTLWQNYRRPDNKLDFLVFVFVFAMGSTHHYKYTYICTYVENQEKMHIVTGEQQSTFVAKICGCLLGYANVVISSACMANRRNRTLPMNNGTILGSRFTHPQWAFYVNWWRSLVGYRR